MSYQQINKAPNPNLHDSIEPMMLTRSSAYMKSLMAPEDYLASIPDDIARRHMQRQLAISSSLPIRDDVPGLDKTSGMIIANMLTPGSNIAAWYGVDVASGKYKFIRYIKVSQELTDNYNYSRHVSGILTYQNASLSATGVVLSGTFNSITYDNNLSELNIDQVTASTFYDEILGTQANPYDQVGSVMASNGVVNLALPNGFNVPYTRLGDPIPVTSPVAGIAAYARDDSESINYDVFVPDVALADAQNLEIFRAKIDQWDGSVEIDNDIQMKLTFTDPVVTELTVAIEIQLLDLVGNTTDSRTYYQTFVRSATSEVNVSLSPLMIFNTTQPISGVALSIINGGGGTLDVSSVNSSIKVPNGSRIGVNTPITLNCYSGIAVNTQMVVKGVKNYELVPNPNLMKTATVSYPKYDEKEMEYVRQILYRRDVFGLRSVMPLSYYYASKPQWVEMGELDKNEYAEAFDGGTILRGLKAIAAPMINTFLPGVGGMVNSVMDSLIPNAAGGSPMAAGGKAFRKGRHAYAMDDSFEVVGCSTPNYYETEDGELREVMEETRKVTVGGSHLGLVIPFPVITTYQGIMEETQLYGVFPWTEGFFPPMNYVTSKDGFRIWNYSTPNGKLRFNIGRDVILLRIYSVRGEELTVGPSSTVRGSSCEAALSVFQQLVQAGVKGITIPITGGVHTVEGEVRAVEPNTAYNIKQNFLWRSGIPLIGSDKTQMPIVKAKSLLIHRHLPDFNPLCKVEPMMWNPGRNACAADLATLGAQMAEMQKMMGMLMSNMQPKTKERKSKNPTTLEEVAQVVEKAETKSSKKKSKEKSDNKVTYEDIIAAKVRDPTKKVRRTMDNLGEFFPKTLAILMDTKATDEQISAILSTMQVGTKGLNQAQAQRVKYEKVAKAMVLNNSRLEEVDFEDVLKWVIRNGGGPDATAAAYIAVTGRLPSSKDLSKFVPDKSSKNAPEKKHKAFVDNNRIDKSSKLYSKLVEFWDKHDQKNPDANQFLKLREKYGTGLIEKKKKVIMSSDSESDDESPRPKPRGRAAAARAVETSSDDDDDISISELSENGRGGDSDDSDDFLV